MSTIAPERATAAATARRPQPPAPLAPNALPGGVAAGVVGVLWLWWSSTPSFSGFGDWLTNAARITGRLAGYGVVVLVALMARIPPVERGVGADRLARWHAMGGRYVVSLLLSYPDVLAATFAGLLLVAVGVSSARAARRRLKYETWHYLHFYTYLAVALAFSHQFADGAEFMSDRAARVAWSALYGVVGLAIFGYRIAVPIYQACRHQLRVAGVRREAPGVVSITVTGRHLAELRAEPGQFFRWRFLSRALWWVPAPYSLSAVPEPHRLRITVKALGEHSAALGYLRPGTRVVTEGPYGALTAHLRRRLKALLIAGGIGITPLRALFASIPARPGELIFGLPGER